MTQPINRRTALAVVAGGATTAIIGPAAAQEAAPMPTADAIERSLAAPVQQVAPAERVTVQEFKVRPDLRRRAPSIDIQTINFEFGSDQIPGSESWKIERIATALRRILRRDPDEFFLIEGHTDAVGSAESNLSLSERRASTVTRELVRFGIRRRNLEPVGFGESDLLVPTQNEEWRNRRVVLRRITDFIG